LVAVEDRSQVKAQPFLLVVLVVEVAILLVVLQQQIKVLLVERKVVIMLVLAVGVLHKLESTVAELLAQRAATVLHRQ